MDKQKRIEAAEALLQRCLDGFGAYINGRKMARGQRDRLREDLQEFLAGRSVKTSQPDRQEPPVTSA